MMRPNLIDRVRRFDPDTDPSCDEANNPMRAFFRGSRRANLAQAWLSDLLVLLTNHRGRPMSRGSQPEYIWESCPAPSAARPAESRCGLDALDEGCPPVMPPTVNPKETVSCDVKQYKEHSSVECVINHLKLFRRIAPVYGKTALSFPHF